MIYIYMLYKIITTDAGVLINVDQLSFSGLCCFLFITAL